MFRLVDFDEKYLGQIAKIWERESKKTGVYISPTGIYYPKLSTEYFINSLRYEIKSSKSRSNLVKFDPNKIWFGKKVNLIKRANIKLVFDLDKLIAFIIIATNENAYKINVLGGDRRGIKYFFKTQKFYPKISYFCYDKNLTTTLLALNYKIKGDLFYYTKDIFTDNYKNKNVHVLNEKNINSNAPELDYDAFLPLKAILERKAYKLGPVYFLKKNDNIVGYLGPNYCYNLENRKIGKLGIFYVDEQTRGEGIGTMLFASAMNHFCKNDVNFCSFKVETKNTPVIKIYEKFGFQKKLHLTKLAGNFVY